MHKRGWRHRFLGRSFQTPAYGHRLSLLCRTTPMHIPRGLGGVVTYGGVQPYLDLT